MKVYVGSKKLPVEERIDFFFDTLEVEKERHGDLTAEQIIQFTNQALDLLWEAKEKLESANNS